MIQSLFYNIFFSTVSILAGIGGWLFYFRKRKIRAAIAWAYGGLFFAAFFMLLPFEKGNLFYNFFQTLYNSVLVFTGDFGLPLEDIPVAQNPDFYIAYTDILSVVYLLALLLSAGFIISYLPEVQFLFSRLSRKRPLYVFSVLDERTILTGKDIRKLEKEHPGKKGSSGKQKKAIIVYMNSDPDQDDIDYLKKECQEISAHVLNNDIKNYSFQTRKGETNVLLAKKKDAENVQDFIELIDENDFRHLSADARNNIYIFCSSSEYEGIINRLEDKHASELSRLHIYTVDNLLNNVYTLFYRYPLYINLPQENTDIRLLIIGNSRLSRLLLRTAAWIGQMLSHGLKIAFFCDDPEEVQKEFIFLYPELMNREMYDIEFGSLKGRDSFEEMIRFDPTYVAIAYENEELNLQTGTELAQAFRRNRLERDGVLPVIAVWAPESELEKSYGNENSRARDILDLIPFGSMMEQFNFRTVFHSRLNEIGLKVHRLYGPHTDPGNSQEENERILKQTEDTFFRNEYNRKSSIASGIHNIYKLEDLRHLNKGRYDLKNPVQLKKAVEKHTLPLSRLEHRRWNAYMRSIGYRKLEPEKMMEYYLDFKIPNQKDTDLKLHACLAEWDDEFGDTLSEMGKQYSDIQNTKEIRDMLEEPDYDELDRVTLWSWLADMEMQKKIAENPDILTRVRSRDIEDVKDIRRMTGNFKSNDSDILAFLYDPDFIPSDPEEQK